jgi:hypothetical protein
MPAQLYTVNYRVSDPEDFIDCSILINLGTQVSEIQEWQITATSSSNCLGAATGGSDNYVGNVVTMRVLRPGGGGLNWFGGPDGDSTNGYYAFIRNNDSAGDFPSWNALVQTAASGNIVINGPLIQQPCGWVGPDQGLFDSTFGGGGYNLNPGLLSRLGYTGLCLEGNQCFAQLGPERWTWELISGFNTNTPMQPPVENYTFSFQNQ